MTVGRLVLFCYMCTESTLHIDWVDWHSTLIPTVSQLHSEFSTVSTVESVITEMQGWQQQHIHDSQRPCYIMNKRQPCITYTMSSSSSSNSNSKRNKSKTNLWKISQLPSNNKNITISCQWLNLANFSRDSTKCGLTTGYSNGCTRPHHPQTAPTSGDVGLYLIHDSLGSHESPSQMAPGSVWQFFQNSPICPTEIHR